MLAYLMGLVCAMVAASYAAVPLYRRFCQATGYGGTIQRRESVEQKIARHDMDGTVATREIVVQFNADVADGMPWKFIPTQRDENRSSTPIVGVSTYNVTPMKVRIKGANVVLCSDPSHNGPDDFHVIASSDHEKFEDLRSKGYQLLGPQCVFACANKHRSLPKQEFTCCLALDGVNILVAGFDADEKNKIMKLVTSMGGVLTKTSLDVSFVIAKNVLAAKYKTCFMSSSHLESQREKLSWRN